MAIFGHLAGAKASDEHSEAKLKLIFNSPQWEFTVVQSGHV